MPTKARAIVAHGPIKDKQWKMQEIEVPDIGEDQLLIRMVASGICHTDLNFGNYDHGTPQAQYPRVLGHEGSGIVEKVGSKVKVAAVGDPVLLSYNSCGRCKLCHEQHPAYCTEFSLLNFVGKNSFNHQDAKDSNVWGSFFGQSSFASLSVVDERSVVNVKGLIENNDELAKLSPLGCGIQTGTGTILNVSGALEQDTVAIIGMGGVGLSCVMAAKIAKAKIIIGIDRVGSRLQLAKELGATHTIDTSGFDPSCATDLIDAIKKIDNDGPSITVDTSGVPALIHQAYDFTRNHGKIVPLGMVPPGAKLTIDITEFMISGKKVVGVIEGDTIPEVWVPKMIRWWKEGKLPFDRLIKVFKAEDFEEAIHQMHTGKIVKPIIVW